MAARSYVRQHWPLLTAALVVAVLAAAGLVVFQTMPPRTIVMATGSEGGAYHAIGKRYQEILAREGVRLRLRPTGGAVENLALLRNPRSGVSVALLQGGTTTESEAPDIESLGTVFYEPLWLFYRSEFRDKGLDALRGGKISIGPEGSGTRALSLELLKRRGIDRQSVELLGYSPQLAAGKLLAGEIDAAVMLIAADSEVIRRLLADTRVELASFPYTDAYVALYPFLNKVMVPAGVGDLANSRPPSDVALIAPKASLVVRSDLHSAIQFLLLNAAVQIHSGAGIFHRAGQFPAAETVDVPLSDEAIQFYKSGRPFLQNYLPFWMASLVARLFVVLIPVVGILYPLLRFLPAIYGWMMRRKIARLYGELRFLEDELADRPEGQDRGAMVARLDHLEQQANRLRIPMAYASLLYMLRHHIDLVRQNLTAQRQAARPPS
jgi:TRAP transporter TAXI family solute receptor